MITVRPGQYTLFVGHITLPYANFQDAFSHWMLFGGQFRRWNSDGTDYEMLMESALTKTGEDKVAGII